MAIADTLESIKTNLTNAYNALENKGAKIPEQKNIQNLAETANSISVGEYNIESVLNEDGTQTLNITHKDYREFYETFADNTPEQIANISAKISANNLTLAQVTATYGWNIGDTKPITLSTGEVVEMQIIGINHDDLSDGSGKAGITLQMVECLATKYKMNSGNKNAGGYAASVMKTETLPTLKALLPQEWQDIIKLVDKKSANGGSTNYSETLTLSEDLFLLSTKEVFGPGGTAQDSENEGSWYEYYETNNANSARIKKYDTNADGVADTATGWWLRSCTGTSTMGFRQVRDDGLSNSGMASTAGGVAFGFCI